MESEAPVPLPAALALAESHHRIRNHLQLLASLLSMQARASGDPRVAEPLKDAQRRILAIARLHGQLQEAGEEAMVDIAAFLDRLCFDLEAGFGGLARFRLDAERARFDAGRAGDLAVIVTELATNALKHGGPEGEIRISLRRTPQDLWRLAVADDGPGLTADALARAEGLGLQIVQLLARRLRGQLTVEPAPEGAVLAVHFL